MAKLKKTTSITKKNMDSTIDTTQSRDFIPTRDEINITESIIESAAVLMNQGNNKVVNTNPESFIDIINNKSSGLGLMTKPFTVVSKIADTNERCDISDYFQDMSDAAYSANNTVINAYVNQMLRYPMLDAMRAAYGCIENEFEFLQKEDLANFKNVGVRIVDALLLKFMRTFDITTIRRALESLYPDYNNMIIEDKLQLQQHYIQPLLGTYSLEATTMLSGVIYDWLYGSLLCECDSSDFSIVCNVLTPIFIEFRDNIHDIAELTLLRLIEMRASSSVYQDTIYGKESLFDEY